jgi:hypothetical protein
VRFRKQELKQIRDRGQISLRIDGGAPTNRFRAFPERNSDNGMHHHDTSKRPFIMAVEGRSGSGCQRAHVHNWPADTSVVLLWRARKLLRWSGWIPAVLGHRLVLRLRYSAIERTRRSCSSEICSVVSSPIFVPYVPVDLSGSEVDRSRQLRSLLVSDLSDTQTTVRRGDRRCLSVHSQQTKPLSLIICIPTKLARENCILLQTDSSVIRCYRSRRLTEMPCAPDSSLCATYISTSNRHTPTGQQTIVCLNASMHQSLEAAVRHRRV